MRIKIKSHLQALPLATLFSLVGLGTWEGKNQKSMQCNWEHDFSLLGFYIWLTVTQSFICQRVNPHIIPIVPFYNKVALYY